MTNGLLSQISQITDKFNQALNVLILLPQAPSGDHLAAGLALKAFFDKLEKESLVVSPSVLNSKFAFLPGFEKVVEGFKLNKSFVIDVSTIRVQIDELSYKKETDRLSIFIKPKQDQFNPSDITFRTSNFPFDLIVCLGIGSLEQLGDFYNQNTELFFETPVVNIDHRANNENYGQLNLVRLNASSTSEIILDLINSFESSLMDENIATTLLTGIITETNSFQHAKTTPQAFLKASQLVSLGARQQEIIGQLYKNKSMGFLKLWGRVLARLKQDVNLSLVYSMVNKQDVAKAGATPDDVAQIIKEMASQLSFAKIFLFLSELSPNETKVACITNSPFDLNNLFAGFKPQVVGQMISLTLPHSLNESESLILKMLRSEVDRS